MSLTFKYRDRYGAFSLDVNDAIRLGEWSLTTAADHGDIAHSQLRLEDPNGYSGHAGDQFLGLKAFEAYESAAGSNASLIYSGYVRDRVYSEMPSQRTGAGVQIDMDLADLNDAAHYRVLRALTASRSNETVGTRLTWLLGTGLSYATDAGLVVYPTTTMDPCDYRNQTPADVLDDCAQAVGYNWFYYDNTASGSNHISLYFDDPNTSTAYASTLRISNSLTDVDSDVVRGVGATETWPAQNLRMTRSPATTASGIVLPYSGATEYVTRASTASNYGQRDLTMTDSHVKTQTQALRRANRLLWESRDEEDLVDVAIDLPRANVNDVLPGQRIQLKTRNMPGYTSGYSWFRVMRRTIGQKDPSDQFYHVELTLSPQELAIGGVVQTATERHQDDITFTSATTVGHLLITLQSWRQLLTTPRPPLGATWTYLGQGNFVDDHDAPDPCAIVAYATIVTAAATNYTKQGASGGDSNGTVVHSTTYEISGATIADLTTITSGPNAASTTLDIGSLGYASFAVAAWGNGYDGLFVDPSGVQVTNPGSWTRDFYASRDNDTTSSNSLFGAGFPFTWYGHASNASLEAVTTISDSSGAHQWGGVAVKIG